MYIYNVKIMYLPWTLGVSVLELGPSLCFFCSCNSEVVLLTADLWEYKCNLLIHFQLWNYDPSSDFLGIFSFHGNDLWCAVLFPSMEKMIKNTQDLSWTSAFKFVFVGFIIFKPGHFIRPCLVCVISHFVSPKTQWWLNIILDRICTSSYSSYSCLLCNGKYS